MEVRAEERHSEQETKVIRNSGRNRFQLAVVWLGTFGLGGQGNRARKTEKAQWEGTMMENQLGGWTERSRGEKRTKTATKISLPPVNPLCVQIPSHSNFRDRFQEERGGVDHFAPPSGSEVGKPP